MNVQHRCGALKVRVTQELQEAPDARARGEILIAALYELSRKVLPELGRPGKSQEYLKDQNAVLELISFLAIHLIRNSELNNRGVAVLAEISEGCLDPLLKKKLSVYSQELLSKSQSVTLQRNPGGRRRTPWLIGLGAAALLALYLAMPEPPLSTRGGSSAPGALLSASRATPLSYQATALQPASTVPAGALPSASREQDEGTEEQTEQSATPLKGAVATGEQTTKVRIVNNQVLVPVTLKNGGEAVRAELVLDTGSTRTSIHEALAGRLRIDLRLAKLTQSEVADGRLIRSRSASLDSLAVGPFTMAAAEVDLIPYKGSEGIHDGLLGMDFLSKHRYQIDMEHELIHWF